MTTDAAPAVPAAEKPASSEAASANAPDAAAEAEAAAAQAEAEAAAAQAEAEVAAATAASTAVWQRRWQEVRDIVAVFLLSVTAILTAWCGFQSSKWGGVMSIEFSQASAARVLSVDHASEARDAKSIDLAVYTQWVDATARGDTAFADYVQARFTPEFAVAFAEWQADGRVLPSPFREPSYVPNGQVQSVASAKLADAKFAA